MPLQSVHIQCELLYLLCIIYFNIKIQSMKDRSFLRPVIHHAVRTILHERQSAAFEQLPTAWFWAVAGGKKTIRRSCVAFLPPASSTKMDVGRIGCLVQLCLDLKT